MPDSSRTGLPRLASTRIFSPRTLCDVPKRRSSIVEPATYVPCSCCSVTRHTAREHTTEAKVHYPYHPQFGEAVIVRRRLFTHNVEMAVRLACLPASVDARRIGCTIQNMPIPNDFHIFEHRPSQ